MSKSIKIEMYINGEHIGDLETMDVKTALFLREATAMYSSYLDIDDMERLPDWRSVREHSMSILGHFPKKRKVLGEHTVIQGTSITWPKETLEANRELIEGRV